MLVDVAHYAVGVFHLRNHDEGFAAVPVDNLEHGAGGAGGGAAVVELAVERVAVGGVGDHRGAVLGGAFGEEEIGAGVGGGGCQEGHTEEGCCKNTGCFHIVCCFIVFEMQKYEIILIWYKIFVGVSCV